MKRLEFKPEQFSSAENTEEISAEIAQDMFDAWYKENIDSAPTVYGNPEVPSSWGLSRSGWCDKPMTHTARLVDIKEIEK